MAGRPGQARRRVRRRAGRAPQARSEGGHDDHAEREQQADARAGDAVGRARRGGGGGGRQLDVGLLGASAPPAWPPAAGVKPGWVAGPTPGPKTVTQPAPGHTCRGSSAPWRTTSRARLRIGGMVRRVRRKTWFGSCAAAARGRLGQAGHRDVVDGAEEVLVVGQALREVGQVGGLGEVGEDVGRIVQEAAEIGRLRPSRACSPAPKADEPVGEQVVQPALAAAPAPARGRRCWPGPGAARARRRSRHRARAARWPAAR